MSPQVLDPDIIEALRELGGEDDPELLGELIELYCDDSPQRVAAMMAASGSGDWKQVEGMAHALKSASANLGAVRLSELCRQIEAQAKSDDPALVVPLVEQATTEYAEAAAELQKLLA